MPGEGGHIPSQQRQGSSYHTEMREAQFGQQLEGLHLLDWVLGIIGCVCAWSKRYLEQLKGGG